MECVVLSDHAAIAPFERLVACHGAAVLRVCRSLLSAVDADDAWQETFLSALRAYPDLDPEADHQAWLVAIAYRKAIDVHRAHARRATPMDSVPDHPVTDADPAQLMDLRAALSQLTDRQRAAVVLHHVAGLRFAEVARVTGSTATATRKAASDGMAALRAALTSGGPT